MGCVIRKKDKEWLLLTKKKSQSFGVEWLIYRKEKSSSDYMFYRNSEGLNIKDHLKFGYSADDINKDIDRICSNTLNNHKFKYNKRIFKGYDIKQITKEEAFSYLI